MEKILRIFNKEYGDINQAALLLGFFAFLSQILGLLRDRSFAHFIGPGPELDVYYAAFRVPDLIFISVASLASITVLIPFLLSKMSGDSATPEARKFLDDVFTMFFLAMAGVAALAFFLMPFLVSYIAPGFAPGAQMKVVELSRIMLLSPILLGLSNLFGSISQLFRRFFIYALSPIFYNLGIIAGVLFLYPMLGIAGLAVGVVIGALFHFLIQVVAASIYGFAPRVSRSVNFSDIKSTVLVSLPRTLGLSFNSLALLVLVALASFFATGAISIFNFSLNLQSVPLGIVGLSYAVAAFPILSKSYSDKAVDKFKEHLCLAARQIIFWSLPVTFLFIVLRAQIVRVILGSGSFSWDHTRLVAASLAVFSISIVAQGLIALFARAYYAGGNTRRPLVINLISSLSIVFFSFLFLYVFKNYPLFAYFLESSLKVSSIPGTEVLVLPLGYSLGTILNGLLLWYFIRRDFLPREVFIAKTFFQSLCASFFIGAVAYFGLNLFAGVFNTTTFWGIFLQGLLSGLAGILAGIVVLTLLGNEELKDLTKTLKTRFWRGREVSPIQEGL